MVGRLPPLSQPPLLLARLLLRPTRTLPTPRPHLQTATTPDTMQAQPIAARQQRLLIRWARWLRRFLRVASLPPSKARPTTCVGTPGSALPTAQTAFTIAWYLVPAASPLFDRWSTPV